MASRFSVTSAEGFIGLAPLAFNDFKTLSHRVLRSSSLFLDNSAHNVSSIKEFVNLPESANSEPVSDYLNKNLQSIRSCTIAPFTAEQADPR